MGDKALIQLRADSNECSPVLYLHWGGSAVADIIARTEARMANRPGDVSYIFARLVQEAIATDPHGVDTGFGVWNQTSTLTAADSHGDAGCFLVDVSRPKYVISAFGGYGLKPVED